MRKGQVMLLTIVILSAGIASASIVSGMIVLFQLRQTINAMQSTQAAYAADAGLECELYKEFADSTGFFECDDNGVITCGVDATGPFCRLPNSAIFRITRTVDPVSGFDIIKSIGEIGRSTRAFEVAFAQITQCNDREDNEIVPDGLIDWDGGGGPGLPDPDCTGPLDTNESA